MKTSRTRHSAASALSKKCSSACSATYVLLPSAGYIAAFLHEASFSASSLQRTSIAFCIYSNGFLPFIYHANRLPAKGQGRALLSGHPTTKTRNSMTYPGASLGRSKGRSRGKEGKGGNSLHIFYAFSTSRGTTSRRRSSGGSRRRRRREGEPSAGHRHRNARGRSTRLIPILLQDREILLAYFSFG